MPLLKSLFCFKGFDNGRRFLVISLICYLFFLILSPVLAKAAVLLILLLLVCTPVLLASAIRRIHDAGFATPLAGIPVAVFWLCVFGVTYIEQVASWTLSVLAVLVTLVMTTINNAQKRRTDEYVMGYSGPVDLGSSPATQPADQYFRDRIEPTLATGHVDEKTPERDAFTDADIHPNRMPVSDTNETTNNEQWEQKLGDWVSANRQLSTIGAVIILIIVIASLIWPVFNNKSESPAIIQQPVVEEARERLNKIELPDGFWIMLDQYDALTIAWQGEYKNDQENNDNVELWSAITGKGDRDCFEISFGRNDKFRSMKVTVKNLGDYYADFSPVDTKKIIQAIALKDRFRLCGYEFSLKGTQAKLMVNKEYATYLTAVE